MQTGGTSILVNSKSFGCDLKIGIMRNKQEDRVNLTVLNPLQVGEYPFLESVQITSIHQLGLIFVEM